MRCSPIARLLTKDTVTPGLVKAQYAVRGPLLDRATQIKKDLASGKNTYPFNEIREINTGNPQATWQKPTTFPREVLTLVTAPHVLKHPKVGELFSEDSIERAKLMIDSMHLGTGAYTSSPGYEFVRKNVAKFIEERDNKNSGMSLGPVDPENLLLTEGASRGVQFILQALVSGPKDGVMIPIPQYPLYSATIDLNMGTPLPYYLREDEGWTITTDDLTKVYEKAVKDCVNVHAFVLINPGNPTGQVMDRPVLEDIVKFCHDHNLLLLSDEVYQENIYAKGKSFHSAREVMKSLGEPYASNLQLVSLHTVSKGLLGECGRRGGYLEMDNISDYGQAMIKKLASINLCSNVGGQVMVDLMVKGPSPGSPSYPKYAKELSDTFSALRSRSAYANAKLKNAPGITMAPAEGAMYAFPQLHFPQGYIDKAKKVGKAPDALWAFELLETTGIVVVPGSGFGQVPGTHHVRLTILHSEFEGIIDRILEFHSKLLQKYN